MTATLGALILTSLLAQNPTPSPDASPSAGVSPAPSATAVDEYVRRGPATAPRMVNSRQAPGNATIVNSGSTNVPGYTVVVHPDLWADVTAGDNTVRKRVPASQVRWLYAKLRAAMPLSALPSRRCMKSVSFGSATTIAYGGETTPDLSCPGDATTRELARIASVIVDAIQLPRGLRRGLPVR